MSNHRPDTDHTDPTRPNPAPGTERRADVAANPTLPVIDLVPSLDRNGVEVWTAPDERTDDRGERGPDGQPASPDDRTTERGLVPLTPVVSNGLVVTPERDGDDRDHPSTQLPNERFAAQSADDLAAMIAAIRAAEQGDDTVQPVTASPDGRIQFGRTGQHQNVESELPKQRFAAPPEDDSRVIGRLDPDNLCGWQWHEEARGWAFVLRPDVFNVAEYVFLIRREPSRRSEWFAYCLAPNLDHLVGHRHHLQRLDGATVVCLRPGFRGHASIPEVHAALTKWCLYIEFVRRDLPAPFSA